MVGADRGEPSAGGHDPPLTAHERLVLRLSAAGLVASDVADVLGQSPEAVYGTLASAIDKLGARSKLEAVLIALRRGMIELPSA